MSAKRNIRRIDYKTLHETGEKVDKEQTNLVATYQEVVLENKCEKSPISNLSIQLSNLTFDNMSESKKQDIDAVDLQVKPSLNERDSEIINLESKFLTLLEEIDDHIDENPINKLTVSIEDIDSSVDKVERLRSQQRAVNREIARKLTSEEYKIQFGEKYELAMTNIKEYIIHAKERKNEIRHSEKDSLQVDNSSKARKAAEEDSQKKRSAEFLVNEVHRLTSELSTEFSKDVSNEVSDEEIMRRKDDLPSNLLKLNQLSTKFQQCLEKIPDSYDNKNDVIKEMNEKYEHLIREKELYEKFVQLQISERELLKEKSFQVSSLNIKLQKFKSYETEMDIYTFQSEFEKLYLKSTPRKMLPDLLKYNHLAEPALSLVKSLDNIDDIWSRLQKAYGDPKTMLNKKLSDVRKIGALWKIKDNERIKEGLINIINAMSDLIKLAKRHNLEGRLYYGDGLDMIYGIMGETRITKWLTSICDESLEGEALWKRLIIFLEKELKIQQEMALINRKFMSDDKKQSLYSSICEDNNTDENTDEPDQPSSHLANTDSVSANPNVCSFCNEEGHIKTKGPNGKMLIQYFSCKKFAEMNPLQRYQELRRKGLCYMCLYPGALQNDGKHSTGGCQKEFSCKDSSHDKYDRKKHVLVCHEHRDTDQNKKILEIYKRKHIENKPNIPNFAKEIKLSFVSQQAFQSSTLDVKLESNDDGVITENGVYMLQTIKIGDQNFTIFFDTGCSDMVSRHNAIQRIGDKARLEVKGPILLGGVGDVKTESQHGIYQVRIPLHNGKNAVLTGVCLDQITRSFPLYPMQGKIQNDIIDEYVKSGGIASELPNLPKCVGGDVDFMIGSKYLRYHPEPIFALPSGLTIYKSPFLNADGSQGVIGGPHSIITEIDKLQNNQKMCQHAYLTEQHELYRMGFQVNPDNHLLSVKQHNDFDLDLSNIALVEKEISPAMDSCSCQSCHVLTASQQKHFEEVENAASEILYRCINCRSCLKCRNGEQIEYISVKEEVEQDLINKSVAVDIHQGITKARLPLLDDPILKLVPNKAKALAVYKSQVKKLNKNMKDKDDVLSSESKLQSLGHVEYVKNLSESQQSMLRMSPIQNFIPWSCVWKDNSLSTPCRIVFNASLPTNSQVSLNDILPKGRNNMNKLVEILIRWRSHRFAFHTDVQKMYNSVQLVEEDWCLQRYIWHERLDPNCIPEEKVIKTLIYGVKSSGNQAERALRMTAHLSKEEYPDTNETVQNDIYVDDCMSGESSEDLTFQRADELSLVLRRGGFGLKGFTFSHKNPPKDLSEDGKSINVAGMKWFSKDDYLQLDIGDLNFAKRCKGKHMVPEYNIPEKLTRRQCVSKVAEVFDLTGMLTPITASMKLDLHTLIQRQLKWDDTIPDDLRPLWNSNLEMIQDMKNFKFNRAIVPENASSLDIDTIDSSDASKSIACIAIYARFPTHSGKYSCQLIFGRSKLVPEGMTVPRAELFAANINAHTGEVVKRSLKSLHKGSLKITDSQVTLHWLNNEELPLKQWVRNRVVEILRFTEPSAWRYVKSADMPADIGTRRGATLADVSSDSAWQKGYDWMTKDVSEFPAQTYDDIKQTCIDASNESSELITKGVESKGKLGKSDTLEFGNVHLSTVQANIKSRYEFSDYLIDPNKYRFQKVVRIIAMVQMFIHKCKSKCITRSPKSCPASDSFNVKITDNEFQEALNYFFRIATSEVRHFNSTERYEKISSEKNGILCYTGRILPTQEINVVTSMTDVMRDLSSTMFCVPIVDKHSPLAYSIINEIHWYHSVAKHSGVETVLRYTMKYAYIMEGRDIVRRIRKSCERCRLLLKRNFNVSMGPVSSYNLTIAPAFYVTQTDLAGPFKAYSPHNKRNTIKIWFVIFCCSTTSTTSIKVMEDYTSSSFVAAFIRFSCDSGYPKILLTDEGSQIIKGCEGMILNFRDAQHKLLTGMQVELEVCPVGGHNMHGKVERKIKSIKESLSRTITNERLSILQWETIGAEIGNSINDLPLALGNKVADLENMDLITPNRLKLGRNNDRSPVGAMNVTSDPTKFATVNKQIFNAWFDAWLISHVPKLMHHPKWFNSDSDLEKGDIVLFLKHDNSLSADYQYGMVENIHKSVDGKVRSVDIKYRNYNENVDRVTHRAARQLVVIHQVHDLDIMVELGEVATFCDMKFRAQHLDL